MEKLKNLIPINEGSLYSGQYLIQKLTPKIEKDVELLKKEFPKYNIDLVKNRYENDGSYTLSISGKNTSSSDNDKLQKVITSKIKEATFNEAIDDLEAPLPAQLTRFLQKTISIIKGYNLSRKKEAFVMAKVIDAMGIDRSQLNSILSRVKKSGVLNK